MEEKMIVDLCIILCLILFSAIGYRRGFVKSVYSIASLIATFAVLALFGDVFIDAVAKSPVGISIGNYLSENINDSFIVERCSSAVVYLISSIITYVAVKFLMKFLLKVIDKLAKLPFINSVNKFLGLFIGFIFGSVWVVVIVNVLAAVPKTEELVISSQIAQIFNLILF
jgi:uncharacterized membrane protein required for colicin V production